MKYLKHAAYALLLLGGINWGIYGLFDFDLIDFLLGFEPIFARIAYDVVGLSALFIILTHFSSKHCCSNNCDSCDKENKCDSGKCDDCENNSRTKYKDSNQETKIYEIKTGEEINLKIN